MSDEPNITQIPMSKEALDRLLADIGAIPNLVLEQHELLVLVYEELENYGHVTPSTYSAIVNQVNRWE